MAPAVTLRSAVALLGRFPALAGVDLDVEEGTVLAVLGPNGAGKTSLLHLLGGLLALRSGTGRVLGCDLATQRRALRPQVGLLGHASTLYPELSAAENLAFGLRAMRRPASDGAVALERVGLIGALATVPSRSLSAGQQRRVGLAWLAARRPALWLLDEPSAGLDEDGRELCDALVEEAVRGGATVVLSSHDPDRVARIADLVVDLAGGVVAQVRVGERARRVA
ncbi:MAG TPA: heme ABC exporter ATP-binding protein CcmA [Acidimicrobiales bacterium]|jgi:heme ABC exporter ATP-binding subunit CcmA|nr:heme ABC exporter ATP-binding protein CcmA [Acidimicrobiales bacterium]